MCTSRLEKLLQPGRAAGAGLAPASTAIGRAMARPTLHTVAVTASARHLESRSTEVAIDRFTMVLPPEAVAR